MCSSSFRAIVLEDSFIELLLNIVIRYEAVAVLVARKGIKESMSRISSRAIWESLER